MSELQERVVRILALMAGLPTGELTLETTFESLALDSLDFVELTLMLGDELGVEIDPEDFGQLVTVRDAVDAVGAIDANATTATAA